MPFAVMEWSPRCRPWSSSSSSSSVALSVAAVPLPLLILLPSSWPSS
uniref:Uncharacterized protein n=1 Tax=Arundo donax TaxID=35708 RepID=A0A0A9GN76_ARUDO